MTSQFDNITSSSNIFEVVVFLLSSLVTGPSFITGSGIFYCDQKWRNQKSFCLSFLQYPETELGILYLTQMSLTKVTEFALQKSCIF